jgi:ABC-2 type transport system permease protein
VGQGHTRAARWLILGVALTTTGLMLAPLLAKNSIDQTQTSYLTFAALALTVLLPVVSILTLTSEWSQRTVLATFTQEPRRARVIKAKVGVAFGALLHNTAAAIVLFFALPTAFAAASIALKSIGQWIDPSRTFGWVLQADWSGHLPQILTATTIWLTAPLAAGLIRTIRREIK